MVRTFNGITPRIAPTAFISEAAYIVGDVEIGEGASIWPGAVIRGDFGRITIGRDTAVEDNCVIHSGTPSSTLMGDVVIGDRVQIGHGAALNCRKIGNNTLIGMNATILHNVEIGNFCVIGAACLVKQDMIIPDNSLVIGVPGKIKGTVSPEDSFWVSQGYLGYRELAKLYRNESL
jgi:carbonic anhydrase/acetyltransferase-like protein (isoleucine patch superfamily)